MHVFVAGSEPPPPGVIVHRVPIVRAGRWARRDVSAPGPAPGRARAVGRRRRLRAGARPGRHPGRWRLHRSFLSAMAAGVMARARTVPSDAPRVQRRMFAPGGTAGCSPVSQRVADESFGTRRAGGAGAGDLQRRRPQPSARAHRERPRARGLALADRPVCVASAPGSRARASISSKVLAHGRAGRRALVRSGRRPAPRTLSSTRRRAPLPGLTSRRGARRRRSGLGGGDVLCLPSRREAFGSVVHQAAAAAYRRSRAPRSARPGLIDGGLTDLVVADPTDVWARRDAITRAVADGWARAAPRRAPSPSAIPGTPSRSARDVSRRSPRCPGDTAARPLRVGTAGAPRERPRPYASIWPRRSRARHARRLAC